MRRNTESKGCSPKAEWRGTVFPAWLELCERAQGGSSGGVCTIRQMNVPRLQSVRHTAPLRVRQSVRAVRSYAARLLRGGQRH